jgi:hypothetical protein
VETERVFLVKIGHYWIDLSKIEYLEPSAYLNTMSECGSTVHMDSGQKIILGSDDFKELMDKLQAWHLLAS